MVAWWWLLIAWFGGGVVGIILTAILNANREGYYGERM